MGDQFACSTTMLIDLKHKSNAEDKWIVVIDINILQSQYMALVMYCNSASYVCDIQIQNKVSGIFLTAFCRLDFEMLTFTLIIPGCHVFWRRLGQKQWQSLGMNGGCVRAFLSSVCEQYTKLASLKQHANCIGTRAKYVIIIFSDKYYMISERC